MAELSVEDTKQIKANLATLAPMFEKAEREGLWFRSFYQNLWFSPAELKAEQAKGQFCWDYENWELRNPQDKLDGLEEDVMRVMQDYVRCCTRMSINNNFADKLIRLLRSKPVD